MKIKRKCWILCLILAMFLAGCGKKSVPASKDTASSGSPSENSSLLDSEAVKKNQKTVAISMPSQASEKWISGVAAMNTLFTDNGCEVLIEFAEDDAQKQISQIETFIEQPISCLIISPVPSADLRDVLEKAKEKEIPIISYDRLIMETNGADYYAGFDNLQAGRQIGEYIVQEKELKKTAPKDETEACTIEFFMGDPQDYSAKMVHQGIMEVLKPYLDSGSLVCKSGRLKFEDTAILYESRDTAQKNCEALLDANYLDSHLDVACTSSDVLAYGVRAALESREYTLDANWPLVTGQDAELDAVTDILSGYQAMSVFRDTRTLAEQCVEMAMSCMEGKEPVTNDNSHYKNGTKTVPAYLCGTEMVNQENYKKVLLDSGYYTKEQIDAIKN